MYCEYILIAIMGFMVIFKHVIKLEEEKRK